MSYRRWLRLVFSLALFASCAQPPVIIDGGSPAAPDASVTLPKPEVLLLLDTSGSMLALVDCNCVTSGCNECLPDCNQGQRSRWHEMLAAVSGSFENFSCVTVSRDDPAVFTYDLGYSRPFQRLGAAVQQRADGILDRYQDRVQFGLATFDGMRTYVRAGDIVNLTNFNFPLSQYSDGLFSYGSEMGPRVRPDGTIAGRFAYPSMTAYAFIDTGIRSAMATDGALIAPNQVADQSTTLASIRAELRQARPFGGTPTTSALDDLYFLFAQDNPSADAAKRYVILVTDGLADDDFREYPSPGCDCIARGNCPPDAELAIMSCPYPDAVSAAHALHCGYDSSRCAGPVSRLEVITLGTTDESVRAANEAIAVRGGGAAGVAQDAESLSNALNAALDNILEDAAR